MQTCVNLLLLPHGEALGGLEKLGTTYFIILRMLVAALGSLLEAWASCFVLQALSTVLCVFPSLAKPWEALRSLEKGFVP